MEKENAPERNSSAASGPKIGGTRWCQLGAKPLCADSAALQFRNRILHLRPRKADRPMPEPNERNLPFPHQYFDHANRREIHPPPKLLFIDEIWLTRHRGLN